MRACFSSANGGHHPCSACCTMNAGAAPASASQRLSTLAPSSKPSRDTAAKLACKARSTSHSRSSCASRSSIAALFGCLAAAFTPARQAHH
ncbi:MAG: hypothetical protein Q8R69_08390 [Telluria sp.]|nr:hypothetical protein [Telluria sp.]